MNLRKKARRRQKKQGREIHGNPSCCTGAEPQKQIQDEQQCSFGKEKKLHSVNILFGKKCFFWDGFWWLRIVFLAAGFKWVAAFFGI